MHSNTRQNAQLGARIEAVNIGRRIGLRIAKLLRVCEHSRVIRPGLHATQNVITSTVDDAAKPRHLIAAEPLQHARNHRNAARNRSPMHQLNSMLRCKLRQARAAIRDELLIRRHDGFARSQSLTNPSFDGIQPAHQLDHNINIRAKNHVDIVRPYDRRRHCFGSV